MSNDGNANAVGGLLIAFLAGAAVGAAVTALMTPKTGPQLREDLKGLRDRFRKRDGEAVEFEGADGA